MKLQNWAIIEGNGPYDAPEIKRLYAIGDVYGHPTRPDGNHIRTSRIVEIDLERRFIKTASGSRYNLGRMEKGYAAYMRQHKKEAKKNV